MRPVDGSIASTEPFAWPRAPTATWRNAGFFVARAGGGIRRGRRNRDCERCGEKKAEHRHKLSKGWARLHRVLYRPANRVLQPTERQCTAIIEESATVKEDSVPGWHGWTKGQMWNAVGQSRTGRGGGRPPRVRCEMIRALKPQRCRLTARATLRGSSGCGCFRRLLGCVCCGQLLRFCR